LPRHRDEGDGKVETSQADALTIRDAAEADLESIRVLLRGLAELTHEQPEPDAARSREIFRAMQGNPTRYTNLVACREGEIVGFISAVSYLSLFHINGTVLINELVVSARHRGLGIGKALVREMIARSKRDGMDEIEVGTETSNLAAIDFYRGVGFDQEYILFGRELRAGEG
jgi:ribosomal protein S18 acetylase RimI-like enzyme